MSARVWLRRAYETPTRNDGRRILVDRMWPRGVSKDDARIDEWCKDIAPSSELRRWFGHDPDRWTAFRERYGAELEDREELVGYLVSLAEKGRVTLVFGAKDEQRNNAVVLREVIDRRR